MSRKVSCMVCVSVLHLTKSPLLPSGGLRATSCPLPAFYETAKNHFLWVQLAAGRLGGGGGGGGSLPWGGQSRPTHNALPHLPRIRPPLRPAFPQEVECVVKLETSCHNVRVQMNTRLTRTGDELDWIGHYSACGVCLLLVWFVLCILFSAAFEFVIICQQTRKMFGGTEKKIPIHPNGSEVSYLIF